MGSCGLGGSISDTRLLLSGASVDTAQMAWSSIASRSCLISTRMGGRVSLQSGVMGVLLSEVVAVVVVAVRGGVGVPSMTPGRLSRGPSGSLWALGGRRMGGGLLSCGKVGGEVDWMAVRLVLYISFLSLPFLVWIVSTSKRRHISYAGERVR